jgi:hypothetical protein
MGRGELCGGRRYVVVRVPGCCSEVEQVNTDREGTFTFCNKMHLFASAERYLL